MKKASTSNSVGLTRIKSLMKKIEKQTALVVAEELYMKQMIDMCKEREIAIKYRDSKNSMIKSSNKVSSVGFKLIALMQQKEEKYRDASSQAKRLITKMELVEDDDKVLLSGIISKLQHRAKGIALDLKRLESKRREISGRLIETKFSHEQYLAERENDYRHRHGILEELLEKLKKKEDAMACKGTRSYFEKSIKLIHNRMKILEDEFKDTKDSIKRDIELITMAHGKCYNGIVDGMEGEREKCKVCVDLSEFILRKARDGVNRRKISRMLLTRCQASDKPRTCYEAAMSLMANYDEEVITKTPLGFCVKANKCVVRDW
ncbi:Saposin B-type domain-containing protein [Entamoeba marina]